MLSEQDKAEMVAAWAHRDQTDMAGKPYITHCQRVVENLKKAGHTDNIVLAVGWLHDVVEDTVVSLEDLKNLGFQEETLRGVDAMTQLPGEDLEVYWTRVRNNNDAYRVKLYGDIPDNSADWRIDYLPVHTQIKLRAKYTRAVEFLTRETDEPTA